MVFSPSMSSSSEALTSNANPNHILDVNAMCGHSNEKSKSHATSRSIERLSDLTETNEESRKVMFRLGASAFSLYFLTYFWKVTAFLLPSMSEGDSTKFLGLDLPSAIGMSQSIGYGWSKIPALYIIPRINTTQRKPLLIIVLTFSCLTYGVPFIFDIPWLFNLGIFLSCSAAAWTYALIVTYLEGRTVSEILFSFISVSFIFGGGAARAAASAVLSLGLNPNFMPFIVGVCSLIPSLFFLQLLDSSPSPTLLDREARSFRRPMTGREQKVFYLKYFSGLTACIFGYAVLTSYRNFRDFFVKEIFLSQLGHDIPPDQYFWIETPGGIVCAICIAALAKIDRNAKALLVIVWGVVFSGLLIFISTLMALDWKVLDVRLWMAILSVSVYLPYSLMCAPFFDRMLAVTNTPGTCSFLILASDGAGNFASISMLIWKNYGMSTTSQSFSETTINFFYWFSLIMGTILFVCGIYLVIYLHIFVFVTPGSGEDCNIHSSLSTNSHVSSKNPISITTYVNTHEELDPDTTASNEDFPLLFPTKSGSKK